MTSEPLAQMVLAFSTVEELSQNKKSWSRNQLVLREELALAAKHSSLGTDTERDELALAIRTGLFPLTLRQGVKQLLSRLGADKLWSEWERLYGIRSGLFHGNRRLAQSDINQAAIDTITLCGKIVLAVLAQQGITIPSIATTHF